MKWWTQKIHLLSMRRNCTSKVTYSQFMNDESKAGSIWQISAHHGDQPLPKGADGHIKARRLSSVNISAHHANSLPVWLGRRAAFLMSVC